MLTVNHFPDFERDDECFYHLLKEISDTLTWNLHVYNEADSNLPKEELTESAADPAMLLLRDKLQQALVKLNDLHLINCSLEDARKAWDWFFRTDGHFADFDSQQATLSKLKAKADLLKSGNAFTNSSGAIGSTGVANLAHGFYGEE
jgi:hypothetical protein